MVSHLMKTQVIPSSIHFMLLWELFTESIASKSSFTNINCLLPISKKTNPYELGQFKLPLVF